MSLQETMQAEVERLAAAHEENRAKYREARTHVREAQEVAGTFKAIASVTANELGAARKALEELNRTSPAHEASGDVEAGA